MVSFKLALRFFALLLSTVLVYIVGCGGPPPSESANEARVTVGWASKASTLDPVLAYTDPDFQTVHLIGAGLFEFTGDGDVHLSLAQSATEAPNRLSWTFVLRDGLLFSDGSPLTADDVVATLERVRTNPNNAFSGLVSGWRSVVRVDDTTVRIDLEEPFTDLPSILSEAFTVILPASGIAQGDAFFDHPVMAGPYRLKSWGGSDTVVMEKNPNYWGPRGLVEELVFRTVTDPTTGVAQVRTGQIDIFPQLPFALRDQLDGGAAGEVVDLYGTISIATNNEKAPFNDERVRRAVSLAVDRDQINQVAFGGSARPQSGFWPSGISGWTAQPAPPPDTAAARAQLEGTPCQNGCDVLLMHNSYYPYLREMATVLQQNLEQVGIRIQISSMDTATFYNKVGAGEHQIALSGQYDFLPIPTGFLSYELQYDSGASNFSFYDSAEARTLIDEVFVGVGVQRESAMKAIEKLWAADTPFVTVTNYPVLVAKRENVDDVRYTRTGTIDVARQREFASPRQ